MKAYYGFGKVYLEESCGKFLMITNDGVTRVDEIDEWLHGVAEVPVGYQDIVYSHASYGMRHSELKDLFLMPCFIRQCSAYQDFDNNVYNLYTPNSCLEDELSTELYTRYGYYAYNANEGCSDYSCNGWTIRHYSRFSVTGLDLLPKDERDLRGYRAYPTLDYVPQALYIDLHSVIFDLV